MTEPLSIDLDELNWYDCGNDYTFKSKDGREFGVYKFGPNGKLPKSLARWLRYWSHTDDSIGTFHEGDKYRFNKFSTIRRRFLKDQGGRTLFAAIDLNTKALGGVAWTHELRGDIKDFTLLEACIGHLATNKDYDDHLLVPSEFATIATREYGDARHQVAVHLTAIATALHFKNRPDHLGVVGRFSLQDSLIQDLRDEQPYLPGDHIFAPVNVGPGFIVMLALNTLANEEDYAGSV